MKTCAYCSKPMSGAEIWGEDIERDRNVCRHCGRATPEFAAKMKKENWITTAVLTLVAVPVLAIIWWVVSGIAEWFSGPTESISTQQPQPSAQSIQTGGTNHITGANWFGCRDRAKFQELIDYAGQRNREAFMRGLLADYRDGECRPFEAGEEVFVEEKAIYSGLARFRPRGETQSWWADADAAR